MKKSFILPVVLVLSMTAYAQRADFVSELIAADKASYGAVCYLSAVYPMSMLCMLLPSGGRPLLPPM